MTISFVHFAGTETNSKAMLQQSSEEGKAETVVGSTSEIGQSGFSSVPAKLQINESIDEPDQSYPGDRFNPKTRPENMPGLIDKSTSSVLKADQNEVNHFWDYQSMVAGSNPTDSSKFLTSIMTTAPVQYLPVAALVTPISENLGKHSIGEIPTVFHQDGGLRESGLIGGRAAGDDALGVHRNAAVDSFAHLR